MCSGNAGLRWAYNQALLTFLIVNCINSLAPLHNIPVCVLIVLTT